MWSKWRLKNYYLHSNWHDLYITLVDTICSLGLVMIIVFIIDNLWDSLILQCPSLVSLRVYPTLRDTHRYTSKSTRFSLIYVCNHLLEMNRNLELLITPANLMFNLISEKICFLCLTIIVNWFPSCIGRTMGSQRCFFFPKILGSWRFGRNIWCRCPWKWRNSPFL